jgi:hypothetical protein
LQYEKAGFFAVSIWTCGAAQNFLFLIKSIQILKINPLLFHPSLFSKPLGTIASQPVSFVQVKTVEVSTHRRKQAGRN